MALTIYLSAPMAGVRNNNADLFNATEQWLLRRGYRVVNPISLGLTGSWVECLCTDLKELEKCDAILMLDGWQSSYGCRVEYLVAHKLGLSIVHRLSDL